MSDFTSEQKALFDVLCCIMISDGVASGTEKKQIIKALNAEGATHDQSDYVELIGGFGQRVRTEGFKTVHSSVLEELKAMDDSKVSEALCKAVKLARSDEDFSDREQDSIEFFQTALFPDGL